MKNKNNNSGLVNAIEELSVHDHLCLIYKNKEEQFAAAIPFVRIGLERGEKCVYIADDNTATEVLEAMRLGGIDVDAALKNGSLAAISKREAYLLNGYFDPDEMIQFLTESTTQAKKDGYSALRVTGEMTWMLGGEPGTERLIEYEAKLNQFLPENDCLALCQYNRNRFGPDIILDVIHTHPIVVVGNVVCKNFYYVPVEEFLKAGKRSSEEVDRLLDNLIDRERVEEEHIGDLRFMKSIDKVNRVIQGTNNLKQMMIDVLDVVLSVFDCDRAWLVYPCDPEASSYRVPMERTKPEYPGASAQNIEIPVDPETIKLFQAAIASKDPVTFDPESKPSLPSELTKRFHVQSQIIMAIYPKPNKPYVFGLHQCSYRRIWTIEEKRLFKEIGRILTNALTSLLIHQDLQESEEKYRSLIETANEGIFVIDKERKITFINNHTLKLLGYTKKEIIGRNFDEFVIPEELADHERQMEELLKGNTGLYERRFNKKNGEFIWCNVSNAPMFDNEKKIIGSLLMFQDVTNRKLDEENARRLASIVESSEDAIYDKTLDEIITSWNHGAEKIYGYTSKEAIGQHVSIIVPKERLKELQKITEEVKASNQSRHFETIRVSKDGHRFHADITLSPLFNDHGSIVSISAISRDSTERKNAEIEIIRVNRALKMMSQINQALIHIKDEATLLKEACHIATEIGTYPLAWIGFAEQNKSKNIRPVAHSGIDSDGYVKKAKLTWANTERGRGPGGEAVRTGKPVIVRDVATERSMTPWREGFLKRGYKSIIALPLINNGKTFGLFMIYSSEPNAFPNKEVEILNELAGDLAFGITNLRMKEEHKKAEQHVKELSEVRSKFIDIISHQFRTPLTAVNWNLESILTGDFGKLDETQRKFLQATHSSSIEIIHRLNFLLTAMDIEEKRISYVKEEVDLNNLCAGVVNEMMQKAELKNLSLSYTAPSSDIPTILGDGKKIRMVISILLENAISYTKDKGKIMVTIKSNKNVARFEVTDTGIGIPKNESHRIFERFFRASNASVMQADAFGLGLYVSKNFIEQHGGKVGFESIEGKGSTFWFELPLNKGL